MSDFMSKNYSGLMEAYASIYKQPESKTTINEQVEQVDCEDVDYDPEVIVGVVVEHLVSNGYFDSGEQAFNMLPYLGDAWFNSILQNIVLEESFINDVNSVLDEGYDLSSHTWEELYEAYISHYQNLNEAVPALLAAPMAGPAIAAGLTGLVGGAAKLYQDMQRRKPDAASERWLKTGSYEAKPAAKPAPKPNVYKAEVTSSENRPASSTPTGTTTSGVKVTTGGGGTGGGTPDPNKEPKKDNRPEWMKNFMKGLKGEKKPPSPLIQQAQQKAAEIAGTATRKAAKGALGLGVAGLVDQGLLGGIGGKVTRDIVKFGRSIGPGYEQLKREIKGEPAPAPKPAPTQPEAPKQKKLKFGPDGSVIGLE